MGTTVDDESAVGGSHSGSQPRSGAQHRLQHQHYLAKTVLRGSAVLHAVAGHIRSPSNLDIVFGKVTLRFDRIAGNSVVKVSSLAISLLISF